MTRRRSKLEIYLDILKEINGGETKPTPIMYHVNMSWKPVWRILNKMTNELGLLVKIPAAEPHPGGQHDGRTKCTFALTDYGRRVLGSSFTFRSLIDNDRKLEVSELVAR